MVVEWRVSSVQSDAALSARGRGKVLDVCHDRRVDDVWMVYIFMPSDLDSGMRLPILLMRLPTFFKIIVTGHGIIGWGVDFVWRPWLSWPCVRNNAPALKELRAGV